MNKTCRQCAAPFTVGQDDLAMLSKLSPQIGGNVYQLPAPALCPDCRLQRRLAWRNERALYFRNCDSTGNRILSIFAPDGPYKVFHHEAWYGDGWNALDCGRPFDFSRPFFDQFMDLMEAVPLLALNIISVQNCEYVNECGWSKNCYLTIEADQNEDSMYGYRVFFVKNCVDCTEVVRSQQCYECMDCENCFNLRWSQLCKQCSDSSFLFDCRGCANCFGCAGLRQKKHCLFNAQLTEEKFKFHMKTFDPCNPSHLKAALEQFEKIKFSVPRKAFVGEQNDNVSGGYIFQSKNAHDCFNIRGCRDCRYVDYIRDSRDCMDYFVWGDKAEQVYEAESCGHNVQNIRFCCTCLENVHDLLYCYLCALGTNNCLGCVGLKRQKHCILNRQYAKEEYEALVPKIIKHMQNSGEWGEFYPVNNSPFAYNETTAQDYFPMTQEQATALQWRWKEKLPSHAGTGKVEPVPHGDIANISDDVTKKIFACEATGKSFRVTVQELRFYRDNRLPLPRFHPDERHKRRMTMRNPRKLWDRTCATCRTKIRTSYAPERPEKILCEECYLKEVY
ncbi:hypothetical protein HYW84_02990 [Candidatus Peregrinibacteria bacterium]|nr:hypothetical protein [Candidatus Peregrinibacteria bacterium]